MADKVGASARDEKIAKAHELVGVAISSWVLIEDALAGILGACMAPSYVAERDGQPGGLLTGASMIAGSVMHSQTGFSGKLNVVTEAIYGAFYAIGMPQNVEKQWKSLKLDLKKASVWRNNLAHWSIMLRDINGELEPVLCPSWSGGHLKEARSSRYGAISLSKIDKYILEFYSLWKRLLDFKRSLAQSDELQSFLIRVDIGIIDSMRHNCPERLVHLARLIHQKDPQLLERLHENITHLLGAVGDGDAGPV